MTFRALAKMVAHLREERSGILAQEFKIHEARQQLEELRAEDLIISSGEDESDQSCELFSSHRSPHSFLPRKYAWGMHLTWK